MIFFLRMAENLLAWRCLISGFCYIKERETRGIFLSPPSSERAAIVVRRAAALGRRVLFWVQNELDGGMRVVAGYRGEERGG